MPCEGSTLLPGVIDTHVHLGFFEPARVLRGGVTTVRDLGWPLERVRALEGGPSLLFAGPILTAAGGYPARAAWAPGGTAREVSSEDDAREAVRALAAAGVSVVKIAQEPRGGPVLPPAHVRAIVEEARAAGLPVASHVGSVEQLAIALDAGVAELAHGLWSDEPLPAELVARVVQDGVTVIPTLHVDPSPARVGDTRALLEAGARVVYGTDMGNPPVPPGIDADELAWLVRAGMSAEQALASATSGAATLLGVHDRGRIAPGARADLVLVNGDLRDGLRPLRAPAMVVRAGEIVR